MWGVYHYRSEHATIEVDYGRGGVNGVVYEVHMSNFYAIDKAHEAARLISRLDHVDSCIFRQKVTHPQFIVKMKSVLGLNFRQPKDEVCAIISSAVEASRETFYESLAS